MHLWLKAILSNLTTTLRISAECNVTIRAHLPIYPQNKRISSNCRGYVACEDLVRSSMTISLTEFTDKFILQMFSSILQTLLFAKFHGLKSIPCLLLPQILSTILYIYQQLTTGHTVAVYCFIFILSAPIFCTYSS